MKSLGYEGIRSFHRPGLRPGGEEAWSWLQSGLAESHWVLGLHPPGTCGAGPPDLGPALD